MSGEAVSDNYGKKKKTMNLFTAILSFQKGKGENVAAMKQCVSSLHLATYSFKSETYCHLLALPSARPYLTIFLHMVVRLIPNMPAARETWPLLASQPFMTPCISSFLLCSFSALLLPVTSAICSLPC